MILWFNTRGVASSAFHHSILIYFRLLSLIYSALIDNFLEAYCLLLEFDIIP